MSPPRCFSPSQSGTSWSQQAYVKAGNAEAEDGFGTSVTLSNNAAAVGTPNEDGDDDGSTENAGAAYIFQ
ncbi:MAG: FG-GAP repeat protein [Gammaproteobacteria bacterium]|nr:FG-GAP repeat protein [Gammaproteobacteria bacterium]